MCLLFVFFTRLYQLLTQPSIKPKESESQAVGPGTARKKQHPKQRSRDQHPSPVPEDQALK